MVSILVDKPNVERRRFTRLFRPNGIKYRDFLKPSQEFAGALSKDVSAGGARMDSSTFLSKDARLVVLLELPGLNPIRSIAQVVWQRHSQFSESYEYGLEFIGMSPKDKDAIADYVEQGIVGKPPSRSATS